MAEDNCPVCDPDPARIFYRGANVLGVWDAYPVSEGHALLVTTRHVASWFDAAREEHMGLASTVTVRREAILARHHPDGFSIGETAGQTVPHLHVHFIPRYSRCFLAAPLQLTTPGVRMMYKPRQMREGL